MPTRRDSQTPRRTCASRDTGPGRLGSPDQAETIALITRSRRERMLAIHRHRLPRADLEDCYSQATLELLAHVKGGAAFSSRAHMTNALEQRLLSRIHDRRRALHGRSPIETALATALPLGQGETGAIEILDVRADVERLALSRHDLRHVSRLVRQLPRDQRLVLVHQLWREVDRREFCAIHGWSVEKYRKVAQRARARLRAQLAGE